MNPSTIHLITSLELEIKRARALRPLTDDAKKSIAEWTAEAEAQLARLRKQNQPHEI